MIWLLTLLACAKTTAPPAVATPTEPPTPTQAPPGPGPEPVRVHMDDHLYRATAIRNAVVLGRFEDARDDFRWMAEHTEAESLPDNMAIWIETMRDSASAGAAAESTAAQAMALGEMANACGGCHQALGTGPRQEAPPEPPPGGNLREHMAQHSWTNGQLWAALIEPSGAAWERSLRVLGEDAVPAAEVTDWGLQAGSAEQDQTVHRLAYAALSDDNPDTRADLYGQIVAACATCHRAARGEPPL